MGDPIRTEWGLYSLETKQLKCNSFSWAMIDHDTALVSRPTETSYSACLQPPLHVSDNKSDKVYWAWGNPQKALMVPVQENLWDLVLAYIFYLHSKLCFDYIKLISALGLTSTMLLPTFLSMAILISWSLFALSLPDYFRSHPPTNNHSPHTQVPFYCLPRATNPFFSHNTHHHLCIGFH